MGPFLIGSGDFASCHALIMTRQKGRDACIFPYMAGIWMTVALNEYMRSMGRLTVSGQCALVNNIFLSMLTASIVRSLLRPTVGNKLLFPLCQRILIDSVRLSDFLSPWIIAYLELQLRLSDCITHLDLLFRWRGSGAVHTLRPIEMMPLELSCYQSDHSPILVINLRPHIIVRALKNHGLTRCLLLKDGRRTPSL